MKKIEIRRIIAFVLSFAVALTITATAAYKDDFVGSYSDLNCAEDDCDCLEPETNRFRVVSPVSTTNSYNEVVLTGTYEEVQSYYKEQEQTDGLPVIPPTTLKVEKFMRYTPYNDNDVIAVIDGRKVTAYQVAVNSVMSGCSAEYMPLCIAFAKALGDTDYLKSLKSGNLTPMMCISGPVSRQLGIDNAQGMISEEANISLGRFMEFSLINLAGAKNFRKNAFGYVQPLVFAENEQACINAGWSPLHVGKGYCLNDSVITASSFSMWGNNLTPATDLPEQIMKVIAWDITEKNLGALGSADVENFKNTRRTILVTESVAKVLAGHYKTKENLESALVENALRPLWMRANAYYYADTDDARSKSFSGTYEKLRRAEGAKTTSSPDWMSGFTYADIETVAVMQKGNTDIVVTGDSSRNKTQVVPGGSSATIRIELPEGWDELLSGIGVRPLCEFYIVEGDSGIAPPDKVPAILTSGTYRILDPSIGEKYLTGEGRVYFDAASNKLHCWPIGLKSATTLTLDPESDAAFMAYLQKLGANSSFTVAGGKVKEAIIRFSSNVRKLNKEISPLTASSFDGIKLSVHANNSDKNAMAGGASADNATISLSDTVTSFSLNLGGPLAMGDAATKGFVKLSGTTVTVNPKVFAGATAVIGTLNPDKTYRTVTFFNTGDGTYRITYNTKSTLSSAASEYCIIIAESSKNNASYAFSKTDDTNVVILRKEIPAGKYKLKMYKKGSAKTFGKANAFADTIQRVALDSEEAISFKASGGSYEFRYEISSNKLSVYPAGKSAPGSQTPKFNEIPSVEVKTPTRTPNSYPGSSQNPAKQNIPSRYPNDKKRNPNNAKTPQNRYGSGGNYYSESQGNRTFYRY